MCTGDSFIYFTCINISGLVFMQIVNIRFSRSSISVCSCKLSVLVVLCLGTSSDGVQLLQRYLDVTRDVQSVSLLAVRVFPRELLLDSRVQNWIDRYRGYLLSSPCMLRGIKNSVKNSGLEAAFFIPFTEQYYINFFCMVANDLNDYIHVVLFVIITLWCQICNQSSCQI